MLALIAVFFGTQGAAQRPWIEIKEKCKTDVQKHSGKPRHRQSYTQFGRNGEGVSGVLSPFLSCIMYLHRLQCTRECFCEMSQTIQIATAAMDCFWFQFHTMSVGTEIKFILFCFRLGEANGGLRLSGNGTSNMVSWRRNIKCWREKGEGSHMNCWIAQ